MKVNGRACLQFPMMRTDKLGTKEAGCSSNRYAKHLQSEWLNP